MTEEKNIYDEMWNSFSQAMDAKQYQPDPMINNSSDTRRGITALSYLRHSSPLASQIANFQQEVKALEPEQYYQPESDLHLTVLSIVTCTENYTLSCSSASDYVKVFKEALCDAGSFDIHFKGITASPSCILLQGFMPDDLLSDVREKLRLAFNNSPLYASIDSRYKIATAHSTIIRFKDNLNDPRGLFDLNNRYRDYEFGTHTVDRLALVFNNWYQQKEHTRLLAESRLLTTNPNLALLGT
ncbi:2'-5' RNA ligase family protein [Photobacterium minamisatsumaniensis]|uniref:2'-5' RNA ligase family protein n=1 Tax=Photobacterium minamisatsumaniensis TaxID=2910233 RepID=UPI003D10C250